MAKKAIMRLKSLRFEGAGTYKADTGLIPLENRGLVLIEGKEGSGKTLLADIPTTILFGKGAPRLRDTALAEKNLVDGLTGYKGNLVFDSGVGARSREVDITQAFKHKKLASRYIIKIDGEADEEPTTKPQARKFVNRLAPISYGEWLGTTYISQGATHDLMAGTPSEKKEYITNVFGLSFCDDLVNEALGTAKELTTKVTGSLGIKQRLLDVDQQLKNMQQEIASLPSSEDVSSVVEQLNKKIQNANQETGRLVTLMDTAEDHAAATKRYKALCKSLGVASAADAATAAKEAETTLASLNERIADLSAKVKSLKKAWAAYDDFVEDQRVASKAVEKKQAALTALEGQGEKMKLGLCEKTKALLIEAKGKGLRTLQHGKDVSTPWRELVASASAAEAQATKIEKLQAKLGGGHGTVDCPTCSHAVDIEVLRDTSNDLRKQAKGMWIDASVELTNHLPDGLDSLKTIDEAIDHLDDTIGYYLQVEEAKSGLNAAKQRLAVIDERSPEKPTETQDSSAEKLASLQEKQRGEKTFIADANEVKNVYTEVTTLERSLQDVDLDGLAPAIEKIRANRADWVVEYNDALEEKDRVTSTRATYKALQKQKKELDDKVNEYAQFTLSLKQYEDEIIPYFTAYRAGKVRSCLSVLELVLPVYVSTIAVGQYEGAELRLSTDDAFSKLIVEMKTGTHEPWIQPLQGSGGQRQRLTLASVAALREVSPRTTNVMFWDEPFTNLRPDGKLLVVQRLIPTLRDRCPDLESIFLIAHDPEVLGLSVDTFDEVWAVRRERTGSSVTTGLTLAEARKLLE